MALTGFDHLVIRVKDIDDGIATYRDKLGLTLDRTAESEALGIKQAFFNLPGGGFVEVVAPTDENSAVGRAVAGRGEGVHTMAMSVDNLAETIESMKAAGVQLIGEGGPQVFVHPKSTHGLLLQLSENS